MAAKIISGTQIAAEIREEIRQDVVRLKEKHGVTPGLVTILVGENPASVSYVTAKQKTSHGLASFRSRTTSRPTPRKRRSSPLSRSTTRIPKFHGILVQLPLPKHVNETKVLYAIDPDKDVDAFHPVNVGRLVIGEANYYPCTPYGIQQLLIRSGVQTDGAEVVVVAGATSWVNPLPT